MAVCAGLLATQCGALLRGGEVEIARAAGATPPPEAYSGGATTVFEEGRNAFALSARNLAGERRGRFFVGNSFFNKNWVAAPASARGRDGLGPLFNTRSCSSCHLRDGRGRPPGDGEEFVGLLLRISLPGKGPHGAPLPHPVYGGQISTRALPGAAPEARLRITEREFSGRFADGSAYTLRAPGYTLTDPGYGPLPADLLTSPRVAPALVGLGLLETVPEVDIVALADPDDADGDGISGRVNRVWDEAAGRVALGRFGWKANQPNVRQQVAGAFLGDMGITSTLFPGPGYTTAQAVALGAFPSGGEPEISDPLLDDVALYVRTLAVPARRDLDDPVVRRGEALFAAARCTACHRPELHTGPRPDLPELAAQTIRPYTDLLLHDMGDGLADGRPDFAASGREWRTPPLWGIGLVGAVNGHTRFLHDGRARNLEEAVLWHGGEAAASKDAYTALGAEARGALLRFLGSL